MHAKGMARCFCQQRSNSSVAALPNESKPAWRYNPSAYVDGPLEFQAAWSPVKIHRRRKPTRRLNSTEFKKRDQFLSSLYSSLSQHRYVNAVSDYFNSPLNFKTLLHPEDHSVIMGIVSRHYFPWMASSLACRVKRMFDTLQVPLCHRDYHALMMAYHANHQVDKVVEAFQDMEKQGLTPDIRAYGFLILSLSHARRIDQVELAYNKMTEEILGSYLDPDIRALMIQAYGLAGDMESAVSWFRKTRDMVEQEKIQDDRRYHEALIKGFATNGLTEDAERVFNDMPSAMVGLETFDALLNAHVVAGDLGKGLDVWVQAKEWSARAFLGREKRLHLLQQELPQITEKAVLEAKGIFYQFIVNPRARRKISKRTTTAFIPSGHQDTKGLCLPTKLFPDTYIRMLTLLRQSTLSHCCHDSNMPLNEKRKWMILMYVLMKEWAMEHGFISAVGYEIMLKTQWDIQDETAAREWYLNMQERGIRISDAELLQALKDKFDEEAVG